MAQPEQTEDQTQDQEQTMLSGQEIRKNFPWWQRLLITIAQAVLYKVSQDQETQQTLDQLRNQLKEGHGFVFSDHVFPLDMPILTWLLLNELEFNCVIAPYAVQLDTGLDPYDRHNKIIDLLYKWRTDLFLYFKNTVNKIPGFYLMPVIRRFELERENLAQKVKELYEERDPNQEFRDKLFEVFQEYESGVLLVISLAAGLNGPDKERAFSPALYRMLKGVESILVGQDRNFLAINTGLYPNSGEYRERRTLLDFFSVYAQVYGNEIAIPKAERAEMTESLAADTKLRGIFARLRERAGVDPEKIQWKKISAIGGDETSNL